MNDNDNDDDFALENQISMKKKNYLFLGSLEVMYIFPWASVNFPPIPLPTVPVFADVAAAPVPAAALTIIVVAPLFAEVFF